MPVRLSTKAAHALALHVRAQNALCEFGIPQRRPQREAAFVQQGAVDELAVSRVTVLAA